MDSYPPPGRRGRWSRYQRSDPPDHLGLPSTLSDEDAAAQQLHFGVTRAQIEHDFVISQVLGTLAAHAELFVFYGGTALSRTILNGLRLSEDIDLLTLGHRAETAVVLDQAIRKGLERNFGRVTANPGLPEARRDTVACIYRIGGVQLKIQLIDGRNYTAWPRQTSTVSQRYSGMADIQLTTYSNMAFVGAKTDAWCDVTRNAPRDLYDLWALAEAGFITAEAAALYRRLGSIHAFPRPWAFPKIPPNQTEWQDALGHQCIPRVGPTQAYETVLTAWEDAVKRAEAQGMQ